jgi:hypothetical protein
VRAVRGVAVDLDHSAVVGEEHIDHGDEASIDVDRGVGPPTSDPSLFEQPMEPVLRGAGRAGRAGGELAPQLHCPVPPRPLGDRAFQVGEGQYAPSGQPTPEAAGLVPAPSGDQVDSGPPNTGHRYSSDPADVAGDQPLPVGDQAVRRELAGRFDDRRADDPALNRKPVQRSGHLMADHGARPGEHGALSQLPRADSHARDAERRPRDHVPAPGGESAPDLPRGPTLRVGLCSGEHAGL